MNVAWPAAWRHPWLGVAAVVAVAAVGAGCTPGRSEPVPPAAPTVQAHITEENVELDGPVSAGRVVMRVTSADDAPHQVTVVRLAEDSPPIDEQLEPGDYEPPEIVARISEMAPGETGMVAVELTAGRRYALVDLSETADGRLHARLGVAAEFRAGGRNATATPRSPDADTPGGTPGGEGSR